MKVLHISSAKSWRGGEQQIYYLINGAKQKIENFLYVPHISPLVDKLHCDDTKIYTYKKGASLSMKCAHEISKICKDQNIDLIHIHDSHGHNFIWIAYTLLGLQTPSVLSRRVDYPISKLSASKYNHPKIKKIICVSNAIKAIMKGHIRDQDKVVTVFSGVERSTVTSQNPCLRTDYNVNEHSLLIGNLAAISEQKDYTTFVNTAVRYAARNPSRAVFFIIGQDGGQEQMIRKLIQTKKAEEYIHITGYIDGAKEIIHQLDCLLFTSMNEGLGTTILDAMIQNVPVVATSTGGIPEIITHNKSGLLAEVGDHRFLCTLLERVTSDKRIKKRLTSHGRAKAARFSTSEMTRSTLKIYHKVLNMN